MHLITKLCSPAIQSKASHVLSSNLSRSNYMYKGVHPFNWENDVYCAKWDVSMHAISFPSPLQAHSKMVRSRSGCDNY